MEKEELKTVTAASAGTDNAAPQYGETATTRPGLGRRIIDSFKRDPNAHVIKSTAGADGNVFDLENAAANTANSPLQRRLKGRHLQMIAIGGSIGMTSHRPWPGEQADFLSRYRSLCRFGLRPGQRWPGVCPDRLRSDRCHAVLHRARPG